MKQVWAGQRKDSDIGESSEWLARIAQRNLLDPDVLAYPATRVLKATNGERNILYMPVQTSYVLESLGIGPESTPMEVAKGLEKIFQVVRWEAERAGIGECYFLCRDEETVKFAEHHEMERVNIPLFRFKVKQ